MTSVGEASASLQSLPLGLDGFQVFRNSGIRLFCCHWSLFMSLLGILVHIFPPPKYQRKPAYPLQSRGEVRGFQRQEYGDTLTQEQKWRRW